MRLASILLLLPVAGWAASSGDLRLVDAVKDHDKEAATALLKQHADVNAAQPDGATALHWAAHWDDAETADLLLRAGANVNAANELGVTPLYLAGVNGNAAMIEKLLAAGANPNAAATTGVSPLMTAARSGNTDAVKALLAHGANVNARENSRGQTALMWAVAQRHAEAARVLIEHGADVQARSRSGSLFVFIAGSGNQSTDPRGVSKSIETGGSPALLFAARQGDIECAKVLLDGGANVNDTDSNNNSALVVAAHSGQGAFAAFLLDRGANPNASGAGYTALHAAVLRDEMDLVKALLAHGANVDAPLANGTPLQRQSGDFFFATSTIGATPFWLAAKYGDAAMMGVLAAGGANTRLTAKDGTTPLMAAAGADHRSGGVNGVPRADEKQALAAAQAALEGGTGVTAANQAGDTALHTAASRGYVSVVQLLADRGAKLDVKNKRGQTPLMMTQARRKYGDDEGEPPPGLKATADLLRKLGAAEPTPVKAAPLAPKNP
jgi:ankyrin repeat protein